MPGRGAKLCVVVVSVIIVAVDVKALEQEFLLAI